jgi:hypothetical protein
VRREDVAQFLQLILEVADRLDDRSAAHQSSWLGHTSP